MIITGESGFLGSVLFEVLNRRETPIFTLNCGSQAARIDISSPFNLRFNQKINTVIHAAGKAHSIPKTEEEKQAFYDVNFEGTKNLCRALEGLGQLPKSFIFISTVAVYGVDKGSNINEQHALNGITPYAESKLLAEEWLTHWAKENSVTLGILRLPLVAGRNPPGNLGAMIRGIKSGRYLSIGQANARKSIVWAEDVAQIIPALAEQGGTYNLTDGHHPTFGELETQISKVLGKKSPKSVPFSVAKGLARIGDLLGDRFPINSNKLDKITSTLTFDDRKARAKLGWNPTSILSIAEKLI